MKTISHSSTLLALSTSLILFPSAWGMSSDLMQQQASKDTLAIRSGSGASAGSPFKLLPPFYPQKDTAGFQLIPIHPEAPPGAVVENSDITR